MAKVCTICGKGPTTGNRIIRKGLPKKKGGIGLHTTGISRRRFLPNLQKVKVTNGKGGQRSQLVCASCLKAGKADAV